MPARELRPGALVALLLTLIACLPAPSFAQDAPAALRPPTGLTVGDNPNDNGHGVLLHWTPSPDDSLLLVYEVWRGPSVAAPDSAWFQVGTEPRGGASFVYFDPDPSKHGEPNPAYVPVGEPVLLRVRGRAGDGRVTAWTKPATGVGVGNWFHTGKTNILVATLAFGVAVMVFIARSRRGRELYIRPIPGLSAVDEAIGRATEMGTPILYVLGTGTASDIATIAGYTILSRVARRTAEYQTPILVPVNDPVMLAMGQEVVKEAYVQAGRPEVYKPDNISYVSAMQFPYVAAVNGLMQREQPATCFYMGVFHAESLLLAETGSGTGAIQISGTDQISQIPFFVAATDYTLIGEELYAASAYLSQEPAQIGPLKAQDYAKVVIIVIIIVGILALTLAHWDGILQLVRTPV
ncbi:MAG: DUF6754 domain-containing protein [Candidatus Krumholzibacteriia bacterium]|nr:hypothetical protein [bacterium]MCB9514229.1 hypothetical protein [Candidatus Latescibacterota bacterium]MCB9515898.1 hypothetical protein [Candidatus Latescibacterota bacterium]